MKTMTRTAAPDVAQLMADNGWKQVDSVTWRKPTLTVNMYLDEQEIENNDNPATVDFGEVTFTVSNVVVHAVNGEYDASLDYKGTQYQGDLVYEDLVDLVNESDPYLTPEFDFDLTDLLIDEELDRMDDEKYNTAEARRERLENFEKAVADGWKADGDVLTRDHMGLKYNVGHVRVELDEESTIKDFGTVDIEVDDLTLKLFNDGAYLKLKYAGKVYEGGVDVYSVAVFLDNNTLDREFNANLDQVITQDLVDNYTPAAREGQRRSLRRTAADDNVAQRLIAAGWTQVDEHKLICDYVDLAYELGEVEIWSDPEGSKVTTKDYGTVEVDAEDLALTLNDDGGAHLKLVYDGRTHEGDLSKDDLAAFVNDFYLDDDFNYDLDWYITQNMVDNDTCPPPEPPDRGREYDKYLDEYEYRNEPGNRYYEGQQHDRLQRTAISDVAKLLVDNGWEPQGDDTWTKQEMHASYYVGEWGPHDYDEVGFEAKNVLAFLKKDGSLAVVFEYGKDEYAGVVTDSGDNLEEFIVYGMLPYGFNDDLCDPLVADAEGAAIDWAEYMYVDR